MYQSATYDFGKGAEPYRKSTKGLYTHYIDMEHNAATDKDNPYGTIEKPRKTMPPHETIIPGSVIEVHGGPDKQSGKKQLKAYGTIEKPIFVRGESMSARPVLTEQWYLSGSYLIFENIHIEAGKVAARTFEDEPATHHVSIRNCEISKSNNSTLTVISYNPAEPTTHSVVFNNFIHSDYFNPEHGLFYEQDAHGVIVGQNTQYTWVVDNQISHMTGDAFQSGHDMKHTAKDIYIGRNKMFTCGENAVDTKEAENIIVSQNEMFHFLAWDKDKEVGGCAVVIHYGPRLSTKNIWVLYNEIYNTQGSGIQVGGDQKHDVYLIGNIIRDINNSEKSGAGYISWSSQGVYMFNNLFYNVDNGIKSTIESSATLYMNNNIIANVAPAGYHLILSGRTHPETSQVHNNLFYQEGASNINLLWKNNKKSYTDMSLMSELSPEGEKHISGNIIGNPDFANAAANNYETGSKSACIDAGKDISSILNLFNTSFGLNLDIFVDGNGVPRPTGAGWDIGPWEN